MNSIWPWARIPLRACVFVEHVMLALGSPTCCCSGLLKTVPQELSCLWFLRGGSAWSSCSSQKGTLPVRVWRAPLSSQHERKKISKENSNPEGSNEKGRKLGLRATASILASPWREAKVSTEDKWKTLSTWCLLLEWLHQQKPRPGANSPAWGVNTHAQLVRSQSKGISPEQKRRCSFGWGPPPILSTVNALQDEAWNNGQEGNLSSFLSISSPGSVAGLVP